jgi:hypothetical protein
MKKIIRILLVSTTCLIVFMTSKAFAGEWYESMESSGIDQSQSALKSISANGNSEKGEDAKASDTGIDKSSSMRESQISEKFQQAPQSISVVAGTSAGAMPSQSAH